MAKKSAFSQCTALANYLNEHETINTVEAMEILHIFRLSARIADLRHRGLNIVTEWNRETTSIPTYRLIRNKIDFTFDEK